MKDKILLWLDDGFAYLFAMTYYLQNKYDSDLFAVIDVPAGAKKFFEGQQLVRFQKIWYYNNDISKKPKPDLEYLKYIEEKYKINLWSIAYTERFFYNEYNKYYKFKRDEILSIIEIGCRLFEGVLDEIKPDFVLIRVIDRHHSFLLYQLCKAKAIKIIILESARFLDRFVLTPEVNKIDNINSYTKNFKDDNRIIEDPQNYIKHFTLHRKDYVYTPLNKVKKWEKIKALLHFLFIPRDKKNLNRYNDYGKTKLKIITKGTSKAYMLKKWYRENFINKNFIRNIDGKTPFVYFPLHTDPEEATLVDAPFYTNQLALITSIAKSLPVDYYLYVKEHDAMFMEPWRSKNFYKQILDLPNVKLIHPAVNPEEIMEKCLLLITITGTAAMEAAFYNKPSIIFADTTYSCLKSVYRLKTIEELPHAISMSLKKKVDMADLSDYVNFVEKNSFEFDWNTFNLDFANQFYYAGFLKEVDVPVEKMKSFLEAHKSALEKLASEYIKKIKQYKECQFTV